MPVEEHRLSLDHCVWATPVESDLQYELGDRRIITFHEHGG